MYIQTETTPNPDALKFLPDLEISRDPVFFDNKEQAINKSSLATKLFDIDGVIAVFFGSDFITVTKTENLTWEVIKPEILMTIMDHFVAGFLAMDRIEGAAAEEFELTHLSDVEKQIYEIIETRIRPSVAMDGGDITYKRFEDGIVYLKLRGSCAGCPSSEITLKKGILATLQHFVPEVIEVEAEN